MTTNVRFYGAKPCRAAVLHGGPGVLGSVAAVARESELVAKTDNYCPLEFEDEQSDHLSADGKFYSAIWNETVQLRKSGELLKPVKQIACPVVVIHGATDPHPPEGVKTPLAKGIGNLRICCLEKCGHHPWKEQYASERFYEILRQEIGSA